MKTVLLVIATMLCSGCSRTPTPQPIPITDGGPGLSYESGYRHLMKSLADRDLTTCETINTDGSTCLEVKNRHAHICGPTRDAAAEKAAQWIDDNVHLNLTDAVEFKEQSAATAASSIHVLGWTGGQPPELPYTVVLPLKNPQDGEWMKCIKKYTSHYECVWVKQ